MVSLLRHAFIYRSKVSSTAIRKPLREALDLARGDIVTVEIQKHPTEENPDKMTFTTRLGYHGLLHIPTIIQKALQLEEGDLIELEIKGTARTTHQ